MATKAKDLLAGLLERSRARVCRIAPFLRKAVLSFLSCRECEQRQGYLIHSLSYSPHGQIVPVLLIPEGLKLFLIVVASEAPQSSIASLSCINFIFLNLLSTYLTNIRVASSPFVTEKGKFSFSLCSIFPCIQTLEHYQDKAGCPVHFLMHYSHLIGTCR